MSLTTIKILKMLLLDLSDKTSSELMMQTYFCGYFYFSLHPIIMHLMQQLIHLFNVDGEQYNNRLFAYLSVSHWNMLTMMFPLSDEKYNWPCVFTTFFFFEWKLCLSDKARAVSRTINQGGRTPKNILKTIYVKWGN